MKLHEAVLCMISELEYGQAPKLENVYVGRKEYYWISQSDHAQRNEDELMFCGLKVYFVNVESHLKVA